MVEENKYCYMCGRDKALKCDDCNKDKKIEIMEKEYQQNDDEINAWDKFRIEEKKMDDANDLLIDAIGRKDFTVLVQDCRITNYLSVVDKPKGDNQDERQGVFTELWVDQWSTGDSGDSYAGNMYAKFAEDKWLKIPYDC